MYQKDQPQAFLRFPKTFCCVESIEPHPSPYTRAISIPAHGGHGSTSADRSIPTPGRWARQYRFEFLRNLSWRELRPSASLGKGPRTSWDRSLCLRVSQRFPDKVRKQSQGTSADLSIPDAGSVETATTPSLRGGLERSGPVFPGQLEFPG